MTSDAFVSILEAPLDPYDVPDVGDTQSGDGTVKFKIAEPERLIESARLAKPTPTPIVPFTRSLMLGSSGPDVIGAKRAIWHANDLGVPRAATRMFGPIAVNELKAFQKTHGLSADGVLGPETLRKLGPFFDRYAFFLYTGFPPNASREQRVRAQMVSYAVWGYNSRAAIHYAEFRPMRFMNALEQLPIVEDCSTFVTKDYKYANADDPNDMGYNGFGNTVTMRQHGKRVSIDEAKPGDLAHYDGPQHVAVYVGHRRVVSHGSEAGPLLSDVFYRPLREIRNYF